MNEWYAAEGKKLLDSTQNGRTLFIWEAAVDGIVLKQFDDHIWMRALRDISFVPKLELGYSTDILKGKRVESFLLLPTAFTRNAVPWFNNAFHVYLRPDKGEKLVAHWLVDVVQPIGVEVARYVLGIENASGDKILTVISPSGKVTLSSTEDVSYEGE